MKKGDVVYAATINFGGGVLVEAAAVVSVGEKEVRLAGEDGRGYPGHAFNYGSRLHHCDWRLAPSRGDAIARLVERCRSGIEQAEEDLVRRRRSLAAAETALAAEPKP